MSIIQNAFFCTTPYQIITSVVLNEIIGEKSDIYIIPQFKMAAEYAQNLEELNLFNRVKLVETAMIEKHKKAKNKFLMHVGIVQQYFNVEAIAETFLFPNTEYKKMYVSSKAYIPRMAYLYCIKKDVETELVYYDDGEGSYYNKYRIKANYIDKIIRRMIFGKKAIEGEKAQKIFLYEPELYRSLNDDHYNNSIIAIPHIINKQRMQRIISKIFNISERDLIPEKAIILDVLKTGKFSKANIEALISIYSRIQETFSRDNTIVKKHPRDKSDQLTSFKCYERYNVPFECLCTQMNMNEKVLISVSSTAVILPKILLGQEPIVILLYKLIDQINQGAEYHRKQDAFYQLCKKNYSVQDKFYIPESNDELLNILQSFL